MKIFVTGATGYIGSAVIRELLTAGHHVLGLARSDAAATHLTSVGADTHRGTLGDLNSLYDGVHAADGVIHLAFNNISENTDFATACRADLLAVETMGTALEGSGKPFVVTSGMLVLAMQCPGHIGTEEDIADSTVPRVASENAAISLAARGVRSSVVRLAPCVHGEGDRAGFVTSLIGIARTKGVSSFIGDGSNRWPAVHRLDAARLFRMAVEAAPAGSRLHGTGEEGRAFRVIALAIGQLLKLPVVSVSPEDADNHFGFLSTSVQFDNPTSSALTRQRLGWLPQGPKLTTDIEQGHYLIYKR